MHNVTTKQCWRRFLLKIYYTTHVRSQLHADSRTSLTISGKQIIHLLLLWLMLLLFVCSKQVRQCCTLCHCRLYSRTCLIHSWFLCWYLSSCIDIAFLTPLIGIAAADCFPSFDIRRWLICYWWWRRWSMWPFCIVFISPFSFLILLFL